MSQNGDSSTEQLLIKALTRRDGWYECPKDANGKRLGPLVGYAGRDKQGRQFVGDVYLNAAVLERDPRSLSRLSEKLIIQLRKSFSNEMVFNTTFCGAPMGGLALANYLAYCLGRPYVYPEKKVTAIATEHSREQSQLVFQRHEVREGEQVLIVEDVCNNFSTTEELVSLIESHGGGVIAIMCLANRSLTVRTAYDHKTSQTGGHLIPIFSLWDRPILQYGQDDPEVAEDVAKGNVVWKPKNEWARLMEAMNAHRATA